MLKKLLIGGVLGVCALTSLSPVARADGDRDNRDRGYRPAPSYRDRDNRYDGDRDRDDRRRDFDGDRDHDRDDRRRDYDRDRDYRDRDRRDYRRDDYRGGGYGHGGNINVYGGGYHRPRYDDRYDRRRRRDDRPRYDNSGRIITGAILGGILGGVLAR